MLDNATVVNVILRWRDPGGQIEFGHQVLAGVWKLVNSATRFEELENFLVLLRSEIGADAHVHHRYFPLGGA